MPTLSPERSLSRVYRRPLAYTAGSRGTDGKPLDARTLMLAAAEAGHLIHESTRHLANAISVTDGPIRYATVDGPWDLIPGLAKPPKASGGDFYEANKIPWDRHSAQRFEVSHVIEDRLSAEGDPLPRSIAMRLYATVQVTAPDLEVFFAMTYSPSPRSVAACTAADQTFATATIATGTSGWATATLSPVRRAPSNTTRMRARASVANGGLVSVTPFWLWFGWRMIGGAPATGANIHAISAFETR